LENPDAAGVEHWEPEFAPILKLHFVELRPRRRQRVRRKPTFVKKRKKKRKRITFDRASDEGVVEGGGRGQRSKRFRHVNRSLSARARVPTAAGGYSALPTRTGLASEPSPSYPRIRFNTRALAPH